MLTPPNGTTRRPAKRINRSLVLHPTREAAVSAIDTAAGTREYLRT